MEPLNLPPYNIKVTTTNGQKMIFDILRRRYISLTPEEWVRQHFIHYLIEHQGYPEIYLQNEVEVRCGSKRLRCDSILYSQDGSPKMILEYKAPTIPITEKVFNQIYSYNILLHVDYLVISNGKRHFCCKIDYSNNSYTFLPEIPHYSEL